MDDGNLNENIDSETQAIEGPKGEKDMDKEHQVHLDPSRWWFASSAFPMIAGTLGPVASAFSICALVRPWRQHIPPGLDVTQAVFMDDPVWLTAINAVQLVIALIANLFLLLNMTKRIRFSVAQPITIVGWFLSAICLTGLVATASGPLVLKPEIEYVWSQAFYYGIYAAILYFVVASLMSITVWGSHIGYYPKDFDLSISQRTLMLQTIMFLMYLLLGALVFSTIEGWNYLDTVYWADVTLFTVGYGDFSPLTTLGRALMIPYSLVGVISLGLVIGSIRSLILDRGKRRLDARMLERKRRQLLRHLHHKGRDGILEPISEDHLDNQLDWNTKRSPSTEFERRQMEFELMRKIQERASTRRRWSAMGISFSTWLVLWLVGAKVFQESEAPYQGWNYFESFYFAFTGLTTIGYGSPLTPVSPNGKAFFVFWSLLALPTMTVLISNAGDTIVKWVRDGTLRVGNLTILPGESGFKKETKQLLGQLSRGAIFAEEALHEDPPGFLGAAQPHEDEEEEEEEGEGEEIESKEKDGIDAEKGNREANLGADGILPNSSSSRERSSQKQEHEAPSESPRSLKFVKQGTDLSTMSTKSKKNKRPTSAKHKNVDEELPKFKRAVTMARDDELPTSLPKTRAEYHLILIDEISRVTKHLQHTPPRKYTFKEWAWYLRLVGEDESKAETHRRPARKPNKDNHDSTVATSASNSPTESTPEEHNEHQTDVVKWSWVGHRSPLMDTKEEAEWILDRLEQKLKDELQAVVKEQDGENGVRRTKEEEHQNEYAEKKNDPTVMGGD